MVGGGGSAPVGREERCTDLVQTADEEQPFAALSSASHRIRAGIRASQACQASKGLRCCDTHMYSAYTASRHNTLTSVGAVRDGKGGEGLELRVTAASDWRPPIRSVRVCVSETDEGKGCKNHTP